MTDMKLLAAQRNLENAERLGQADRVTRVKKRIRQLQKEESATAEAEPVKSEAKPAGKPAKEE